MNTTNWLQNEIDRRGDVNQASLDALPKVLEALEGGTPDAAGLLYVIAGMAVGRPERIAERIRAAGLAAKDTLARSLTADSADARAGAVSALVAVGASDTDRIARLAGDQSPLVRRTVALAFGVSAARITVVERLLEDDDETVRYAAALALQKVERLDQRVARTLAAGAAAPAVATPATDSAPWSKLYPQAEDALSALAPELVEPILPLLLDRFRGTAGSEATSSAELLLKLGFGSRPQRPRTKPPTRLTAVQRDVLDLLAAGGDAWKARARMAAALGAYGLPAKRADLQRWLKSI